MTPWTSTLSGLVAVTLTLAMPSVHHSPRAATLGLCSPRTGGTVVRGGVAVSSSEGCAPESRPGRVDGSPVSVTLRDCGPPTVVGRQEPIASSSCAAVYLMCDAEATTQLPTSPVTDVLEVDTFADGRTVSTTHCRVAPPKVVHITGEMARESAERLLPHPGIGMAPAGDVTLVNIETVLWVQTLTDRTLGTVTLFGQRVTLRAHVRAVRWDFGDGVTGESDTPGKAYTDADPCRTVQCPDYFGHTYRHSGSVTIGAQLIWTGDFRVGAGPWQPITGTVTAPAMSETVRVKEARAVLVPNP